MNTFKFVGKIQRIKDKDDRKSIETKTFDSGWMIKRCRFRMACGDSTVYLEASGGKYSQDDKNLVYTYFTKEGGNAKETEKAQVNWGDRFDPAIIDRVPRYKRFTVDLSSDKIRDAILKEGNTDLAMSLANKKFSYIAQYDFVSKIEELLYTNGFGDSNYIVSGNIEYTYSINKNGDGVYYKSFVPTSISLATDDDKVSSRCKLDFYYDKNDYLGDPTEEGDIPVNGYLKYYDNMAKGNYYVPTTIFLKNGYEKNGGLKNVFAMDGKDGDILTLSLITTYYSGAPKVDITKDDLSDDQLKLIEWGVKTLEETIAEMGSQMYDKKVDRIFIEGVGRGCSGPADLNVEMSEILQIPNLNDRGGRSKSNNQSGAGKQATKPTIDLFSDDDDDMI